MRRALMAVALPESHAHATTARPTADHDQRRHLPDVLVVLEQQQIHRRAGHADGDHGQQQRPQLPQYGTVGCGVLAHRGSSVQDVTRRRGGM